MYSPLTASHTSRSSWLAGTMTSRHVMLEGAVLHQLVAGPLTLMAMTLCKHTKGPTWTAPLFSTTAACALVQNFWCIVSCDADSGRSSIHTPAAHDLMFELHHKQEAARYSKGIACADEFFCLHACLTSCFACATGTAKASAVSALCLLSTTHPLVVMMTRPREAI